MGDYLSSKQKKTLKRSSIKETASNYSDAVDQNSWIGTIDEVGFGKVGDTIVKNADYISNFLFGKKTIPTMQSNCTLTATQWVNPNNPISRAETIIKEGDKYGYIEIPESHLRVGDLVIATNPNNNAHHTMLVSGFTNSEQKHNFYNKDYLLPKGHPLVRYSTGTTHPSGYRKGIGLLEYIDNSEGKTDLKYFRHYSPGQREVLLPTITITPKKNYFSNTEKSIIVNQGRERKLANKK